MWALGERRSGNVERAIELATEAAELLDRGAPSLLNESIVYVVLHDSYSALDDETHMREAVERGMPPLIRRVRGLVGTPYARLFLTELSSNASLVAAAEELGTVPDEIHQVLEKGSS
jgi:hypothetical protein